MIESYGYLLSWVIVSTNAFGSDKRMMVHAPAAMKSDHRKVLIRTVDTDVVVVTVWLAQEMRENVDVP